MATSGSVTSGYARSSCLYVNWQQSSQNIANNTTTINWQAGVSVGGGNKWYSNAVKIYSVYINGTLVYSGGTYSNLTSNGSHQKASGSITIPHSSDGSKSFSVSISGWFYSYGDRSGSGSFSLNSIPRVSDLAVNKTSVLANNSETVTATATKKADSFTDVLTVSLGSYSKTVTSGTAFTIPMDWINAISTTSANATVKLETYSGSTLIGSKTATLEVKVPTTVIPTISSVSLSEAVSAVTQKFGARYVQNLTQLNATVNASGAYGSTIQSYSTTIDGVTYNQREFTTNVLKGTGTLSITSKVVDSRGREATRTQTITVVAYEAPVITSMTYQYCNSDGTLNPSGTCTKITITGKVASVDSQNSRELKLKYKLASATNYTTVTVTASSWEFTATRVITNTAQDVTYEYIAELTDKISTDSYGVSTGKVVISRRAGGDGVTFFGEATEDGFVVKGNKTSKFTGAVQIAIDEETEAVCQTMFPELLEYMVPSSGMPSVPDNEGVQYIVDLLYPIGHILENTNPNFNPNVAYSWQTWERYGNGRVTVGVDSSDTDFSSANKTGGAKTHTLTVAEMPSHTHSLSAYNRGYEYKSDGYWSISGPTYKGLAPIANTGGSQAHNNLQPYITVYRWRRTV